MLFYRLIKRVINNAPFHILIDFDEYVITPLFLRLQPILRAPRFMLEYPLKILLIWSLQKKEEKQSQVNQTRVISSGTTYNELFM